jgi:hypothetical protein
LIQASVLALCPLCLCGEYPFPYTLLIFALVHRVQGFSELFGDAQKAIVKTEA